MIKSVQVYLGTYICVIALCLISVWRPNLKLGWMEFIGNKLSLYVYIYHIAVGKMFDLLAQKYNLWQNSIFKLSRPLLVLGTSLAVALLCAYLQEKYKELKVKDY